MSPIKERPGVLSRPRGCTTPVLLLFSFAIIAAVVFGLGGIVIGTILLKLDETALTDAVNRINEFASGDSDTDGESVSGSKDKAPVAEVADSRAESETSMDENRDGNKNPAQAMTGDEGGVGEEFPAEGLVEADSPTDSQDDQPAPAAEPPPESTSTVREAIPYVNDGLGTGAEVFEHYSYGSRVDRPEPYTFVEPGMCGIRTEIYPMPSADLPGATPVEVVNIAFQAEVASSSDRFTWTPLGEAFELEVNGRPATRLEVMRQEDPDKIAYRQYTVIYGEPISAVVVGQVGNKCYGTVGIENLEILSRVSDTVSLTPQLPVCYIGKALQEEDYSVACDQWGGTGASILMQGDHPDVVLGPTTWNECARFMREHNQVGWEES